MTYLNSRFTFAIAALVFASVMMPARAQNVVPIGKNEGTFQAVWTSPYTETVDITITTTNKAGWIAVGLGEKFTNADLWFIEHLATVPIVTVRRGMDTLVKNKTTDGDAEQRVEYVDWSPKPVTFKIRRSYKAPTEKNFGFKAGPNNLFWAVYRKEYTLFNETQPEETGSFSYTAFAAIIPPIPFPTGNQGSLKPASMEANSGISGQQALDSAKAVEGQLITANAKTQDGNNKGLASGADSGAFVNSSGILFSIVCAVFLLFLH